MSQAAAVIARTARPLTEAEARDLVCSARSFRHFLRHWTYRNRETGKTQTFARVWRGQAEAARLMDAAPWLYLLKAGKLGFTELECAYDGWRLRFGPANARVHLFSLRQDSSRELLRIVRYGLDHLPDWMRLPYAVGEAGADSSLSLMIEAAPEDVRTCKAWPVTETITIDQTCQHAHVDEYARMSHAQTLLEAVQSTVAPGGSLHIVTRGAGPNAQGQLFRDSLAGRTRFTAYFADWTARPRPAGWYDREASGYTQAGIWQYAPRTWQEALQGDQTYIYPQFDAPPGRHRKPAPCALADCERIAIPIDPGFIHPTAAIVLGERSSGGVHQYAEFRRPAIGADEILTQLAAWYDRYGLAAWARRTGRQVIVPVPNDEKTLGATLNAAFGRLGLAMRAGDANREINAGLQLVTQRLNSNAFTVEPDCVMTVEEVQDYRDSDNPRVQYAGERPMKHHADLMDCWRYGLSALAQAREYRMVETRTGRRLRVRA